MKSFLTTVSLLSFLLVGCADNQNTSKDFKEYALSVPEEATQTSYYSFGEDLKKGTKPADKIFTFSKSASATENAGSNIILSNTADFQLVSSTGCNVELKKVSAKCVVKIKFLKFSIPGTYLGTLSVGSEGSTAEVTLSATVEDSSSSGGSGGETGSASLSLSEGSMVITSSYDMGSLNSKASVTKTLALKNEGTAAAPLSISVSGDGYSLAANSCGTSLLKGKTCNIRLTFKATGSVTEDTEKTGSLSLTSDKSVVLTGVHLGVPVFVGSANVKMYESSIETLAVDYGPISTGKISKIITVKNEGTAAEIAPIVVNLSPGFVVGSNSCASPLGVAKSCFIKIELVYSSGNAGVQSGSISVGSKTLNLTGLIGTVITYTPSFEDPVNNLQVCGGSVDVPQVLVSCVRDSDSSIVDNSFCDQSPPMVNLQSPSGTIPVEINNGTASRSCGSGDSVGVLSVSCDNRYYEVSGLCEPIGPGSISSINSCVTSSGNLGSSDYECSGQSSYQVNYSFPQSAVDQSTNGAVMFGATCSDLMSGAFDGSLSSGSNTFAPVTSGSLSFEDPSEGAGTCASYSIYLWKNSSVVSCADVGTLCYPYVPPPVEAPSFVGVPVVNNLAKVSGSQLRVSFDAINGSNPLSYAIINVYKLGQPNVSGSSLMPTYNGGPVISRPVDFDMTGLIEGSMIQTEVCLYDSENLETCSPKQASVYTLVPLISYNRPVSAAKLTEDISGAGAIYNSGGSITYSTSGVQLSSSSSSTPSRMYYFNTIPNRPVAGIYNLKITMSHQVVTAGTIGEGGVQPATSNFSIAGVTIPVPNNEKRSVGTYASRVYYLYGVSVDAASQFQLSVHNGKSSNLSNNTGSSPVIRLYYLKVDFLP